MSYGMPPYGGHMEPPNIEELQDFVARAGEPLEPGTVAASCELVVEALRSVYDPEIPVNIFEMGLIYSIRANADNSVDLTMTLTSPACPVAGTLPPEIQEKITSMIADVAETRVEVVWDPPWNMDMMSEAAKLELGMM